MAGKGLKEFNGYFSSDVLWAKTWPKRCLFVSQFLLFRHSKGKKFFSSFLKFSRYKSVVFVFINNSLQQ